MPYAHDLDRCTLAILAGGRGERMGLPKTLLQIGGRPILQYLLQRFDWPGPTLLVTAPGREHPPGHALFDSEAIDPVEQGPLRGILTALENCRTPEMIVATVDMPALRQEYLAEMLDRLSKRPESLGLMFERTGRKIEPFPLACRVGAIDLVAHQIDSGKLAVHSLTDLPGFSVEPVPGHWPEKVWTNLNHPQEYAEFISAHRARLE